MPYQVAKIVVDDRVHVLKIIKALPKESFDARPKEYKGAEGYLSPVQKLTILEELQGLLLVEVELSFQASRTPYRFLVRDVDKGNLQGGWSYLVYHKDKNSNVAHPRYLMT